MIRRAGLILGGLAGVGVLAFAMQDVIERTILRPLAYLWWVFRLYYDSFRRSCFGF